MCLHIHRHVANLSRRLERDFYQKVFKNCKHDYKEVVCKANTLLFRNEVLPLQYGPICGELPCESNKFFINKIDKIMLKVSPISADDANPTYIENEQQTNSRMKEFKILSIDEVSALIRKTAN